MNPSSFPPGFPAATALGAAVALLLLSLPQRVQAEEKLRFNRDIRPILSDLCFTCHGPDSDKRKGELRLDIRESAIKGGKSESPSILPGKATESELIKRILTEDADEHMPPKKGGKHVKPEQIALLRRWISEGAEYEGHWSFSKIQRPPVPSPPVANPIDAFITARLAKDGLKLAPEADKATLLRRVSLDLTGLPPTPQELDAFLADSKPDAYERVLERLFASKHYGEQMATQWLDFARYADSNGFQADSSRHMSMWRDWVINAFNRNQPFNQFTVEQLAGDLLPEAKQEQIVATGFNRNHRLNGEGGRIEAEWFAETVIDRIETTGNTWLALTVGCARCHDHKFDPLTQKEFYQLFALFNSVDESGVQGADGTNTKPVLSFATAEHTAKMADFDKQLEAAKKAQKEAETNETSTQRQREKDILAEAPKWEPVQPGELKSTNGATLELEADGAIFSSGTQPPKDTYTITADVALTEVTGIRLELLPDDRLPSKGPGRHANGNPIVSEIRLSTISKADGQQKDIEFRDPSADFNQKGYEVDKAVDGKPNTGWAISPQTGKAHAAVFIFKEPLKLSAGGTLIFQIDQNYGAGALLGKFRLSVSSTPIPIPASPEIVEILKTTPAKRTDGQKKKLVEFHKERGGTAAAAKTKMEEISKARANFEKTIPSTMVMKERAEPRKANILIRGQYDVLGEEVPRGLPAALPPLPEGAPMNRLGFAQWLVSEKHPLTSRVWVNRAWERFFGTGIVKTSDNFGSQADWPSHPELLDWLAAEFMHPSSGATVNGTPAQEWDMKALQKLILTSATYRQSAKLTPALLEKDPENRLLARGPRFRLGAETIRDSALSVSGLLSDKVGGPSIRPYMPKGVWDETSVYGDLLNYKPGKGDELYRRTLYTIWKRTAAPPTAMLFDAPSREICTVKRSRTNTPLQALALLNEVTYVEAARKLAERMLLEGGATPSERLQWAFRRVTCRMPNPAELSVLQKGLEEQLAHYAKDTTAAGELVSFGESKPAKETQAAELAAYTVSANVLLNLDEFIAR